MTNPRVLVASGSIDGVDHERLASNEFLHEFVQYRVFLSKEDVPNNFATWIKGWGGECRLEFRLTASLASKGVIKVVINGKLFEGESESDNDLAEEKTEVVFIGKSTSPAIFTMSLFNSGIAGGGGDSGSISLTLTNVRAEEEEEEAANQAEPRHIRFKLRPFDKVGDLVK